MGREGVKRMGREWGVGDDGGWEWEGLGGEGGWEWGGECRGGEVVDRREWGREGVEKGGSGEGREWRGWGGGGGSTGGL